MLSLFILDLDKEVFVGIDERLISFITGTVPVSV